jgi:hypothetical protein
MSLIHTCQLCDANPLEYLIELQRHAIELATSPASWMPWNYPDKPAHAPLSRKIVLCLAEKWAALRPIRAARMPVRRTSSK